MLYLDDKLKCLPPSGSLSVKSFRACSLIISEIISLSTIQII